MLRVIRGGMQELTLSTLAILVEGLNSCIPVIIRVWTAIQFSSKLLRMLWFGRERMIR